MSSVRGPAEQKQCRDEPPRAAEAAISKCRNVCVQRNADERLAPRRVRRAGSVRSVARRSATMKERSGREPPRAVPQPRATCAPSRSGSPLPRAVMLPDVAALRGGFRRARCRAWCARERRKCPRRAGTRSARRRAGDGYESDLPGVGPRSTMRNGVLTLRGRERREAISYASSVAGARQVAPQRRGSGRPPRCRGR